MNRIEFKDFLFETVFSINKQLEVGRFSIIIGLEEDCFASHPEDNVVLQTLPSGVFAIRLDFNNECVWQEHFIDSDFEKFQKFIIRRLTLAAFWNFKKSNDDYKHSCKNSVFSMNTKTY